MSDTNNNLLFLTKDPAQVERLALDLDIGIHGKANHKGRDVVICFAYDDPDDLKKKFVNAGAKSAIYLGPLDSQSSQELLALVKQASVDAGPSLVREYFSDVEAKSIIWLWKDRIPKGMLTIFSGNPDTGKSTVTCDIIARYTTGRNYPDGAVNAVEPGEVLMLIAEDDHAVTVKPRLQAAGADMTRVSYLIAVRISDKTKKQDRMLALDKDLWMLEAELLENPHIGLVVIDPITSYLGRADLNKEQELRRVLIPIKELCENTGATVIGLGHFNKRSDVNALHRVGGAVAMSGVARAVWLFAKDPEVEGEYRMLIGKGNLTARRTGMKYRIGGKEVPTGEAPFIVWQGESGDSAEDVLAPTDPEEKKMSKASKFLAAYLAKGACLSNDAIADAAAQGISERTLWRAKKPLRVKSEKIGDHWWWSLPGLSKTWDQEAEAEDENL